MYSKLELTVSSAERVECMTIYTMCLSPKHMINNMYQSISQSKHIYIVPCHDHVMTNINYT